MYTPTEKQSKLPIYLLLQNKACFNNKVDAVDFLNRERKVGNYKLTDMMSNSRVKKVLRYFESIKSKAGKRVGTYLALDHDTLNMAKFQATRNFSILKFNRYCGNRPFIQFMFYAILKRKQTLHLSTEIILT